MGERSLLRQYLGSLYTYSYKRSRDKKTNLYLEAMRGVFTMHPVFKGKTELKQVRDTLLKAKIEKQNGRFFYSLDENCIPVYANRVIDNMPVDYSKVIDHGLVEFKNEYVDLLCEYIDKLGVPALQHLKYREAENLEEALQRILFYNQVLWQTGHTLMGLGRLDLILSRFPIGDNSEEIIKDFLKVLHRHYSFKSSMHLGDTGQIIILGGLNEDGSYFCNEYTSLIMKCIKEIALPDPKCLLRVSSNMPASIMEQAVDCISTGIGSPLLSNDDVVIPSLMEFGYTRTDAYNYGVFACWEPLAIGCSLEQNNMDEINYGNVLYDTCCDGKFLSCANIDELTSLYCEHLETEINKMLLRVDDVKFEYDPALMFMFDGKFKYNNYGVLTLGLSSAVNSIININKYAYQMGTISTEKLQSLLKNDYKENEDLRLLLSNRSEGFATTNEEAIRISKLIIDFTQSAVENYTNPLGGRLKFGLSSPNYITNGVRSSATLDERKKGTPFSEHISGYGDNAMMDTVIFASKLNYSGVKANGNVVDIITHKAFVKDNISKFLSYVDDCIKLGVFQIQFNVVSLEELIDAKAHPERHKNLIVRVWGFSAYFVDLPVEYQDVLIARASA